MTGVGTLTVVPWLRASMARFQPWGDHTILLAPSVDTSDFSSPSDCCRNPSSLSFQLISPDTTKLFCHPQNVGWLSNARAGERKRHLFSVRQTLNSTQASWALVDCSSPGMLDMALSPIPGQLGNLNGSRWPGID